MPVDSHPSHHHELKKLNRIGGQIEGIKKMIEESRYCPDILTQLRAVRSAVKAVEANILEKHLQHCVADAMINGNKNDNKKRIEELKELFKRYDE